MSQRNYPLSTPPRLANSRESSRLQPCLRKPRSRRRRWRCALLAVVATGLLAVPNAVRANEKKLTRVSRLDLIRGLDREIAVTKVTLPRGKHGVFVDGKGQLDQAKAREELLQNGPAVNPGMPVEITSIRFKRDRIIFEINNGGKNHKKWYQHIQIGAGVSGMPQSNAQPLNTELVYGSSITLMFPHKKVPNLTVKQVKHLLQGVLDFHRQLPTELYSPSIPKKFREAIKNHQVLVGMNRDAVLSSKGPPFRKIRQTNAEGEETTDWLYGLPPHVLFVTFKGDTVVAVQQY